MTEDLEPVPADGPQTEQDSAKALNPPLIVSSASDAPTDAVTTRPLWLAFLAAAVAAFLGGLLWAVISIATGYNLGILAFAIGAATGFTAQLVAGTGIGGFERFLSGLFAAGAVILGNYVIVVHELKDVLPGVGYFNSEEINSLVHHFGAYVHGFDWFWIAIAAYAAIRTTGGKRVLGGGTRSESEPPA